MAANLGHRSGRRGCASAGRRRAAGDDSCGPYAQAWATAPAVPYAQACAIRLLTPMPRRPRSGQLPPFLRGQLTQAGAARHKRGRLQATNLGLLCEHITSGAGHDAGEIAALSPAGMVFVPGLYDGISHNPREYSTPEACADGINVLLQAVLELANEEHRPGA
ncbi:M20/M25/M40 family metallo-hydrolase [Propioniciclava coleopterorum]|nr:M20/M25/M40 family metallo-hydrolase [Propioniciclava coleopterorum]